MLPVILSLLLLSPLTSATASILHTAADAAYPYAVHLPELATLQNCSTVLMLHGSGSKGSPQDLAEKTTWDGIGRQIKAFHDGNTTEGPTLAAQQFLAIMPLLPEEEDDWDISKLSAILDAVHAEYDYDDSKLIISGYSLGAHNAWKALLANTSRFAAAAISAGEQPVDGLESLTNIPIRHYAGSEDESSTVTDSERTQEAIERAGGTRCELIVVEGADHLAMSYRPFDVDMFSWLLEVTNSSNSTLSPSSSTISTLSSIRATLSFL